MGMTMIEKILARHSGRASVVPGEYVWAKVDACNATSKQFDELEKYGFDGPWNPERVFMVNDHFAPAPSVAVANDDLELRRRAREFGIPNYFEFGRHGIMHQVYPENGMVAPGELIVMADSHTTSLGAFNAAACPVNVELVYVLATGELWFRVPESIKFYLEGELGERVYGKDLILSLLAQHGTDAGIYQSLEFVGPGAHAMSLSSRWTVSNMGVEMGAKAAIFECDEKTEQFLAERVDRDYKPVSPDEDADYVAEYTVDLSQLEPMVACPPDPGNGRLARDLENENIKINQAFLGSCTNGRLEDLQIAAEILDGRTIHPDVRLIVSPASQEVWREAQREGYLGILADAGALVSHSTCGPCFGGHLGILGDHEVCISSSNRNFQGRMGSPSSLLYLGSAATVAASALTGKIVDPRNV